MSDSGQLAVIVLAAGQGTRMRSRRPKILHELCGRPMIGHVLETVGTLDPARVLLVVAPDAAPVRDAYAGRCEFVVQEEALGTGHAVLQAEPKLADFDGEVLVLYGDVPLLRAETIRGMRERKRVCGADLVILTALAPTIPGRIVRDGEGRVKSVVEAQDATPEELALAERNTGVYMLGAGLLREGLASLQSHNAQGELYLTDVVRFAVESGRAVEALRVEDAGECLGINTREELADAVAVLRRRIGSRLMREGVTLVDPERTYIDVDVQIGRDTLVEPGCVIQGPTVIGEGCHLKAHTTIESSRLDDDVIIGPCAHLRPDTHLKRGVKIGNFVELKNSVMGPGSKAAHLSYIGDADVGEGCNFGCGSIVVNYDGFEKHRTSIGDDVFIGCNVNLIAPLTLEPHTFTAAGSTIHQTVPEDALGIERARQRNVEGWVPRRRARFERDQTEKKKREPGESGER